jgi:hypothetical protein
MRRFLAPLTLLLITAVSCAPSGPPKQKSPDSTSSLPSVPQTGPKELVSPDAEALNKRVTAVLADIHGRDLLTTHAFWTIFHGILGMGPDTMLTDPVTRERVKALDRVRSGKGIRGLEFLETANGVDVVTQGNGVGQGHQDQFVAEMVEWDVPLDTPWKVNDKDYTFGDFCRYSKERASVTKNQELSWALVIVAKHYGTDHRWKNMYGEDITLEDIARYEATQPIKDAACGGTHRLYGLSWAYHLHQQKGGQTTGVWRTVANRLDEYKAKAKKFQNADGSFSSDYVSSEGWTSDNEKRIASSGHTFEWLCLELNDSEIRQPWMEKAAYALAEMILEKKSFAIDSGALYHATHGLHMYQHRVFGTPGPRGLTIPPPTKK